MNYPLDYWIGFLEGTGSFLISEKEAAGQLVVSSSEEEIINALRADLGKEKGSVRRKKSGDKYIYRWTLHGYGSISIMQKIYAYLSSERRRDIKEVFDYYAENRELKFCEHLDKDHALDHHLWVCGLLQARGQISQKISVQSSNIEMLENLLVATKVGEIFGPYGENKDVWEYNVKQEKAAKLAEKIYPYMGPLRKRNIERYYGS